MKGAEVRAVANHIQMTVVQMLGDAARRPVAISTLEAVFQSARGGDEEAASAAFLIAADVFRQGKSFPSEFTDFLAFALDQAARSTEACQRVAGTHGKTGRKPALRKHRALTAEYLTMRVDDPDVLEKDRIAQLAARHNIGEEAVKTVIKNYKRSLRDGEALLARADALIEKG